MNNRKVTYYFFNVRQGNITILSRPFVGNMGSQALRILEDGEHINSFLFIGLAHGLVGRIIRYGPLDLLEGGLETNIFI